MSSLTIYKDNYSDSTVICNRFIDEYMIDANDAQIKVYLYLIRMMSANRETDISDMADKFNHTEKDILRALKYWEKKQLLTLEYDSQKQLSGIRLSDPTNCREHASDKPLERYMAPIVPIKLVEPAVDVTPITTRTYSRDELKSFKDNPETGQLLFIAETYLNKQLSMSDIESLYFIHSELNFTCELIDFLLQYCIGKEKRSFAYIKKVAINWAENDITTPKQAKSFIRNNYDKSVYAVMKLLGKTNAPTAKEAELITRWSNEYGFNQDLITEACNRTVLATDSHRLEYCDKILATWRARGIHTPADVTAADNSYRKTRNTQAPKNSFNQFQQSDYDYSELEKRLLSN